MWPRGHISNRMRSASFGLRLLRQCERGLRGTLLNWISLAVGGGCTVCSWSAPSSLTIPREDFLRVAGGLEAAHEMSVSRYGSRH